MDHESQRLISSGGVGLIGQGGGGSNRGRNLIHQFRVGANTEPHGKLGRVSRLAEFLCVTKKKHGKKKTRMSYHQLMMDAD